MGHKKRSVRQTPFSDLSRHRRELKSDPPSVLKKFRDNLSTGKVEMGFENGNCSNSQSVEQNGRPEISAMMFAMGVLGNLIALILLEVRRRKERNRQRQSLFHLLVTTLVITDLMGTCLVSPLVQTAYITNTTLVGMSESRGVCEYFGFAMTFLSLVTLSTLLAMALDRCLSIGYPYYYNRHITKRCGYITIPCIHLACLLFCLMPFAGFGRYMQYCPGTWCFIAMNPKELEDRVYANVYATVMLLIIIIIVACNCFVVYNLVLMYRRRKVNRGSVQTRSKRDRRYFSWAEEVEHLILLVFMTVIFVICSLPLMIRVFIYSMGNPGTNKRTDLIVLRFMSVNSIFDPWVFIILNPSVLRFLWGALCKSTIMPARNSLFKSSISKTPVGQIEPYQPSTALVENTYLNKTVQMK
ncbi:hypothetical protein DNTS_033456 [Danionella cerebrum]|uniref:Prostaglandin E2 receptor EP2 subtype n=1 Tax=Danionella cerebrum TaxID=2873325 RepID=A0A553NHD4_9TELE|nr:hypothetical protein DNTS_033456 [Danionella translucida]